MCSISRKIDVRNNSNFENELKYRRGHSSPLFFENTLYKGGVVMKKLLKVLSNSEFQVITVGLTFMVAVLVIINR